MLLKLQELGPGLNQDLFSLLQRLKSNPMFSSWCYRSPRTLSQMWSKRSTSKILSIKHISSNSWLQNTKSKKVVVCQELWHNVQLVEAPGQREERGGLFPVADMKNYKDCLITSWGFYWVCASTISISIDLIISATAKTAHTSSNWMIFSNVLISYEREKSWCIFKIFTNYFTERFPMGH